MLDLKNQKVLVVSPHQDDMEIGCGGLMHKLISNGSEVHVVHGTLVEGVYRKYDKVKDVYVEYTGDDRMRETVNALGIIGNMVVHEPLFRSELHHRLDAVPLADRIDAIEKVVREVKPTMLLVTAVSSNQDHEALNRAVRSVMRPHFYNGVVLEYEIGDEKGFEPNIYVVLDEETMDKKVRAFDEYKTQQSGELHIISREGLVSKAIYRGKQVYNHYAEAYRLIKGVVL